MLLFDIIFKSMIQGLLKNFGDAVVVVEALMWEC
jgi:hypothetical protein